MARSNRRSSRRSVRRSGRRNARRSHRRSGRRSARRSHRRSGRRSARRSHRRSGRRSARRSHRRSGRRSARKSHRRSGRRSARSNKVSNQTGMDEFLAGIKSHSTTNKFKLNPKAKTFSMGKNKRKKGGFIIPAAAYVGYRTYNNLPLIPEKKE